MDYIDNTRYNNMKTDPLLHNGVVQHSHPNISYYDLNQTFYPTSSLKLFSSEFMITAWPMLIRYVASCEICIF